MANHTTRANQLTQTLDMLQRKGYKITDEIHLGNSKGMCIKIDLYSVEPTNIFDVTVSKEVYYGKDPKTHDDKFGKVSYSTSGKNFNEKELKRFEDLIEKELN